MANISINFPEAVLLRVQDALCGLYGYSPTLPDGTPNPQTKTQFARAQVARFVRECVTAWESQQAGEAARRAAADAATRDVTIT